MQVGKGMRAHFRHTIESISLRIQVQSDGAEVYERHLMDALNKLPGLRNRPLRQWSDSSNRYLEGPCTVRFHQGRFLALRWHHSKLSLCCLRS